MSTALDRIIAYKHDEVADLRRRTPARDLLSRAADQPPARPFRQALTDVAETGDNALICEMKRKSPSAGDILPGADPIKIAQDYEAGGAACLSVLTDGPSFGGSLEDFVAIRSAISLPILRKDFMIHPIQMMEARAYGADAVLVILTCTEDALARDLIATAVELGMDVLLETHNAAEVQRALAMDSTLLGINNRDLTRMVTDLSTTEALRSLLPARLPFVSESGITTPEDILRLRHTGARRFLIGESLMKQANRAASCHALRAAR